MYKWTPEGGMIGLATNNVSPNKTTSENEDSHTGTVSSATTQANRLAMVLDLRNTTNEAAQMLQSDSRTFAPASGRRILK